MIRNERQLTAAQRKLAEVLAQAEQADDVGHEVYRAFASELEAEIHEYRSIRNGYTKAFEVDSVDALATALTKARVARHWTHKQLGEALGVSEQMVQRDEAGGYERARLTRLADIADVLGYELHGVLRPATEEAGGSVLPLGFLGGVTEPTVDDLAGSTSTVVPLVQVL